MPKITEMPSGKFHTSIFSHTENGKRVYKSFTGLTRADVKAAVTKWSIEKDKRRLMGGTVREALESYIAGKSNILSPSTLREYDRILAKQFGDIMGKQISSLKQSDLQAEINALAETLAPKTVRNHWGLLSVALKAKGCRFEVQLPQKIKTKIAIPTNEEMKIVFDACAGQDIEVAIVLAAICGMRRSEIVALRWENVDFEKGLIRIEEATVVGRDGKLVTKTTKTTSSTRTIKIIPSVQQLLEGQDSRVEGKLVNLVEIDQIYDKFVQLLAEHDLPKYRFHDLRHYAVSVMLALNIPKNYIAAYVGHGTERMIDQVYGHIMSEKKNEFDDRVGAYFEGVFGTNAN